MSNFLKIWVELSLAKISLSFVLTLDGVLTVLLGKINLAEEPPTLQPTCCEKGN